MHSYRKYPEAHEVRVSLETGMTDIYFKSHGTDLHHPFPKNEAFRPQLPQLWEEKECRSWEPETPRNHKLSMTSCLK